MFERGDSISNGRKSLRKPGEKETPEENKGKLDDCEGDRFVVGSENGFGGGVCHGRTEIPNQAECLPHVSVQLPHACSVRTINL